MLLFLFLNPEPRTLNPKHMSTFNQYMLSLMKDEANGPIDGIVKAVLAFLSFFYGIGIRIVDLGYSSGLRKTHKAPAPVVSVGNLTLGGTGKTPFTVFAAGHFLAEGKKPAILIRGYGKDENRMLKEELPDVPVYTGQDRVVNSFIAAKDGCGVIVLDDGFQHRRIARDLDIVLVDGISLFGNTRLAPRGVLRETVSALERADIIVVTKSGRIDEARKNEIMSYLAKVAYGKPVVMASHRPSFLSDIAGAFYPIDTLSGKKVCLVSGIADPGYFAATISGCGALVTARIDHADHHAYTMEDVREMARTCAAKGAETIVTTKKDIVKLRELDLTGIEDKLYVLNVKMEILEGKEKLIAGLNSVFSSKRS